MAWNRKVELIVESDLSAVTISDLHVDFDVQRSVTFSDNTATFTVYNASEDTRKEILRQGNNLVFKAGYEDEGIGVLFIGNITEAVSRLQGPDWVTEIQASAIRSDSEPLENTNVVLSYAPSTSLASVLRQLGTAMGLVVTGAENANITLPNGWVYVGSTRGALDYCLKILKDNNAALYIDNNTIVIYRTDTTSSTFTAVYLDYDSGLKSVEDITETTDETKRAEKRIGFNSIILPKIQPNGLIQISTPGLSGIFLVEVVRFSGNNYGGGFDCEGEAVE